MVVFTTDTDEEADACVHLSEPFWTMRLEARNADEARRRAHKTMDRDRRLRFLKREGWRICHVGRLQDIKAAGPLRAPGISITNPLK
jgi:hypothetical protein